MVIEVPGRGRYDIVNLVMDYNGTMAVDGRLLPGVRERLAALSGKLELHVLTADTFGLARRECEGLGVQLRVVGPADVALKKGAFLMELGPERTAAIGNGYNDVVMLERAVLSIAVLGREGCSGRAASVADIVVPGILEALELFLHPGRIAATLRS